MLESLDRSVLWFFNQTLASPFLDVIVPKFTSVWWWMPVYVLGGFYLIRARGKQGIAMLIAAILLVAVGDQLLTQIIKPLADRMRPCALLPNGERAVSWIRLPIGERLGPSFPSSHALNNFAVAIFFWIALGQKRSLLWLFIAAVLVSFSRLYLGLHYPSDVLGGAILGSGLGVLWASLYHKTESKFNAFGSHRPDSGRS